MSKTRVSDTTFDCDNDSNISELLSFLKSSFMSEDFSKAETILTSREEKMKLELKKAQERIYVLLEQLEIMESEGKEIKVELKTEIRDLECGKRRAEEEVEIWKKKFGELETRVCMLEEEAIVLRCRNVVDRKQPDEVQVKMDGNKVITSEREAANGGLNGTGVGCLQMNENMVNMNENVPGGIAGFNNPSHVKESRGLPSIDMQRKSLVNAKEDINSTPSESDMDGQRVRKQPAFELEGNSNRKLSPELDNLKTTPGGIIDISDSEDETDIAPNHASNLRDSEMVENEKEPSSRKCIKRLYLDQSRNENESICKEDPLTLTPKRRCSNIVTCDSEDDDKIPISILKMKKLENMNELARRTSGSPMKLCSQTLASGSDNVEASVSPSGKRLLSLRQCEEKNSTAVNKCPNDTKYPNNLNMSDQKARSALVENDSSDSFTDSEDEGDNDLGFNQVIAALRRKKR